MPITKDSFGPEPLHIKLPEGHPVELVSEDDRDWFEDHPDRLLRLRFGTDGDPGGTEMAVLVFCPQDGIRIRMPYTAPFAQTVRLIELDTDSVLGPMFLDLVKGTRRGRCNTSTAVRLAFFQ
jgi:hypothetical protein